MKEYNNEIVLYRDEKEQIHYSTGNEAIFFLQKLVWELNRDENG